MPKNLTRRQFLIGSAAAVAASTLPLPARMVEGELRPFHGFTFISSGDAGATWDGDGLGGPPLSLEKLRSAVALLRRSALQPDDRGNYCFTAVSRYA